MSYDHSMVSYLVDVECTKRGWRVFRNPVGKAWVGRLVNEYMVSEKRGDLKVIELLGAHMITYGLSVGSSDRIGWRTIEVGEQRIAQLVAIECKTPAYNRLSEEQRNFLQAVAKAGGAAFIARRNGTELELEEVKG